MKTIEEACNSLEFNRGLLHSNPHLMVIESFKAGVEFTQRWIPIEEELPESNHKGKILTKGIYGSTDREEFIELAKYHNNRFSNEMDWRYVTHWRPIEYK